MTPDELRTQCHQLIEQIAKRPGGAKLLQGAMAHLEGLSAYKADRRQQWAKRSPQNDSWKIGS